MPVVVANYSNILDVSRRIFNAGTIPVSILKPIETKGMTKEDVDGLVEKTRNLMAEELVRITEDAQKRGIAHPRKSATGPIQAAQSSGFDIKRSS